MPQIESESFEVDARPQYPLLISVKRYWLQSFDPTDDDAFTVVLAHAAGSHNEQWEPVLDELYGVNATATSIAKSFKIRDVWAIECPNHGESAVINEEKLKALFPSIFPVEEYARAIHAVLSGQGKGIDVDFKSRRLVGIGHSMGATALIMSKLIQPIIAWQAMVLVEPLLVSSGVDQGYQEAFEKLAVERPDMWSTREEAHKALKEGFGKQWDPRVLETYVKYGLRNLPTKDYPKTAKGVTLKCSKIQEVATYRGVWNSINASDSLSKLCASIPVYAVFGSVADYLPVNNQQDLVHKVAGERLKGVTVADGEGHFIVQTNPQAVGESIFTFLFQTVSLLELKAKL